ncbi:MAG TPA: hypothetical protein VHD63_26530, partial [Ktedonobacteraceae bacterium]|nr:hypothetical protein [Ktedonobacteraceae bacterium]
MRKLSAPPSFPHLWLPFLDVFLASERVSLLNAEDLALVRELGMLRQQDREQQPAAWEIWQRVFEAYGRRTEKKQAHELALTLLHDAKSDEQTKAVCVRVLASQELLTDQYLDMYMKHLRNSRASQAEPEIMRTLSLLFQVDFQISDEQLQRVHRVAQFLLKLNVADLPALTPQLWTAEGIVQLVWLKELQEARRFFQRASELQSENLLACLGLLACAIQQGDEAELSRLRQSIQIQPLLHHREVAALLEVQEGLRWPGEEETEVSRPLMPDRMIALISPSTRRLLGQTATFMLGYSYLLLGKAKEARLAFAELMKDGLSQPEWGYYAAWAYVQCGEYERAADCFRLLGNWPGRWVVACLLLDVRPQLAEQCGALSLLRHLMNTPVPLANVVRTRLVLAGWEDAFPPAQTFPEFLSLPEQLEGLRTRLGMALRWKKLAEARSLGDLPLFMRLPLVEQTFWRALLAEDEKKRQELLVQTAGPWQSQRAALYLVVANAHRGNWELVQQYKEQALAGRSDLRAQFIQLSLAGYEEKGDETIERASQLVVLGEARAGYVLGNLLLVKANTRPEQAATARIQAALAWQRLLESVPTVPQDLAALAACAAFLAYPEQRAANGRTLITRFQELEPAFQQPWLEWHTALALFWYGTPQEFEACVQFFPRMVELAQRAGASVIAALLQVLAQRAEQFQDQASRRTLLELLCLLMQAGQEHEQAFSTAFVLALRQLVAHAEQEERRFIEQETRRQLVLQPRNERLLLYSGVLLLERKAYQEAATLLREAVPESPITAHLLHALTDILEQKPLSGQVLPGDDGLPERTRELLRLVRTIVSKNTSEIATALSRPEASHWLTSRGNERILASFCRILRQQKLTPPPLLASVFYNQRLLDLDRAELFDLAWCALSLGEHEPAIKLWEAALRKSEGLPEQQNWRKDFVRYLCRQAVEAFQAGRPLLAVNHLKQAAHWSLDESGPRLKPALLEHARMLETQTLSRLLLTALFPDLDQNALPAGRYYILGRVIQSNPQLGVALINRDHERIQQEWASTLWEQQQNMRLFHALALIYREIALSRQRQLIDTEKDWFTSTSLWLLLFSTREFWHYFATARYRSEEAEANGQLSARQAEELWQDALENILT